MKSTPHTNSRHAGAARACQLPEAPAWGQRPRPLWPRATRLGGRRALPVPGWGAHPPSQVPHTSARSRGFHIPPPAFWMAPRSQGSVLGLWGGLGSPEAGFTHPAAGSGIRGRFCYLPDLLDLGAAFADQGSTLAGGDHQPQCHRGLAGGRAVAHRVNDILGTERHTCGPPQQAAGLGEGASDRAGRLGGRVPAPGGRGGRGREAVSAGARASPGGEARHTHCGQRPSVRGKGTGAGLGRTSEATAAPAGGAPRVRALQTHRSRRPWRCHGLGGGGGDKEQMQLTPGLRPRPLSLRLGAARRDLDGQGGTF